MKRSTSPLRTIPPGMWAVIFGVLLSAGNQNALLPALPDLARLYGVTPDWGQAVISAGLIGAGVFFIPFSMLAAYMGSARMFRFSLTLFIITSLLLLWAPSFKLVIFLRFLQGIAQAGVVGLIPAFAVLIYQRRPGFGMGLVSTSVALGSLLGPLYGGIITDFLGARLVFLYPLFFYFPAMYFGRHIPEVPRRSRPLQRVLHFSRTFWMGLLAAFLFFAFMLGMFVLVPLILDLIHYSATVRGLVLLIPVLILLTFGAYIGHLVDRWGAPRVMRFGSLLLITSVLMLGLLGARLPLPAILLSVTLFGLGRGMFQTANNTYVLGLISEADKPIGSGFLSVARVLGQAFGSTLIGIVTTHAMKQSPYASMLYTSVTLGILALPLLFYTAWLCKQQRQPKLS